MEDEQTETIEVTLKYTINRIEKEIVRANQELDGSIDIATIHRNYFKHICHAKQFSGFYFDEKDPNFQAISSKASELDLERDIEYDRIARNHLDIEDMIRVFDIYLDEEGDSLVDPKNIRNIKRGYLISGADVMNYVFRADRGKYCADDLVKVVEKISDDYFDSKQRKDSILLEIQLFKEYVGLCQENLSTLSTTELQTGI